MDEEPAATPGDNGTRRQIRAELGELRGYVSALGLERIKDGTWFDGLRQVISGRVGFWDE